MRHLSAIKHLPLKSASPVRHRTRVGAHDDDLHILRDLLTLHRHALVQTLCAVETEEPLTEIHAAIAVGDAFLAEPEAGAP